jgi:hypothetical protein
VEIRLRTVMAVRVVNLQGMMALIAATLRSTIIPTRRSHLMGDHTCRITPMPRYCIPNNKKKNNIDTILRRQTACVGRTPIV